MPKVTLQISHQGPSSKDFSKEELETLDIENLQETIYTLTFDHLSDNDYIGIADFLKLETKLPMKYLKPIQSSCVYVAQKARVTSSLEQSVDNSPVQIEPMNPDWANGQIRFLPINQSIPLDTIFTISKQIPFDGEFQWVMSSDIISTKPLKELILQENPNAKHFVLTNQKIYLFGQDIGSRLEGKFKVSMTDDIFDSMRLFRFKRPKDNVIELIMYDFLDIDLKYVLELCQKSIHATEHSKAIVNDILKALNN